MPDNLSRSREPRLAKKSPTTRDVTRLSIVACAMLVVLRLSIGWHVLYEGLHKLSTLRTANPWTAEPYLKNAQGPMRDYFRGITGDPDDLRWLDYDAVAADWKAWHQRFLAHHPDLDKKKSDQLNQLLNGPEAFYAELEELPEGVEIRGSLGKAITFVPERKRLIVDGTWHLTPSERNRLLAMVDGDTVLEKKYIKAVNDVFKRSSRLSYNERLAVLLRGDPERVGPTEWLDGKAVAERLGEIELYERQLDRYEIGLATVEQDFERAHLAKQFSDLQAQRSQLVGPVKALDASLKHDAQEMLAIEQLARGPVSEPWTQLRQVNFLTIWGLVISGVLLIAGLLTRTSAFVAGALITLFYLAMPPWPGLPEPLGPEKSLIVNKNFIEALALFCFATMPTGKWFGIDALFRRRK